jgi:hypothetical protein
MAALTISCAFYFALMPVYYPNIVSYYADAKRLSPLDKGSNAESGLAHTHGSAAFAAENTIYASYVVNQVDLVLDRVGAWSICSVEREGPGGPVVTKPS